VDRDAVVERASDAMRAVGFAVVPADSEQRPTLLGLHANLGLLAVDVVEADDRAVTALNRRISGLREDVPELADLPVARRVICLGLHKDAPGVISAEQIDSLEWLGALPVHALEPDLLARLLDRLAPAITFISSRRDTLGDDDLDGRAARRVILDGQQSRIALRPVRDSLLVTGPPGSGKTLVLAARARWLAADHPDWAIQLLCFNKLLVPYLRSLVAGYPNVHVETFGRFVAAEGHRMSFVDEASAARDLARELPRARPTVDALLVDEWQDFFPSWTALLFALLRTGRGGLVLAGDPKQALYRSAGMSEALEGHDVELAELTIPYRSTRQILEVTSAMDPALAVDGRDRAQDGPPVDLVYAENMKQQAAAVASDITLLLQDGQRSPAAIGVLYTRRFQLGALSGALKEADVPHHVAFPREADELDLSAPTVKVITVHSAKGYEFEVVFLFGLEQLPDPDTETGPVQARTGYVGATRAQDQLVITYSKDNAYLRRIRAMSTDLLRPWVWPDDYPDA
jgi:hypothetical protein